LVQLPSKDKATIFENTEDDVRLQNRTVLGWLYAVDAVKEAEENAHLSHKGKMQI